MSIFYAFILGIIEGITEFLPISSTGHLILTADLLNIPISEFLKTFEISIQLGAILSVLVLYWKRLIVDKKLISKVVLAFLPTAVIGLIFYSFIKNVLLENNQVVLWSLFLGGIILLVYERWIRTPISGIDLNSITYKQSFLIGLFQSVSIIPGVSRAAATILGGLLVGLNRSTIVEFSFLLAIPTMGAATVLDLSKSADSFSSSQFGVLAVGFITAFFVSMVTIKWLLKYIQTHNFKIFGLYRIAVALLFWWVVL